MCHRGRGPGRAGNRLHLVTWGSRKFVGLTGSRFLAPYDLGRFAAVIVPERVTWGRLGVREPPRNRNEDLGRTSGVPDRFVPALTSGQNRESSTGNSRCP